MSDEPDDDETQETPAGATIPVPTREDVFADLAKVAKARNKDGGPPPTK